MASAPEDALSHALKSNEAWANYKGHQNPAFFEKLSKGQTPSILWLGCSDSRVPETTLLGLQPGDVFVHRNIGNLISPTDINSSAVIEYAVAHLKVSHIVLCGHTCCGAAAAALGDARVGGVLDTWLMPMKATRRAHEAELKAITDAGERGIRLAELNVEFGVNTLMTNHVVEEAIKERGVKVHGLVFDIASGRLRNLNLGTEDAKGEAKETVAEKTDADLIKGKHATLSFKGQGAEMVVQ